MAKTGALEFESEVDGQEQLLLALLAPAAAPQSGLAFEPEEGDVRDRLNTRSATNAAGPGQEDLASLLQLAAGKEIENKIPQDAGGTLGPESQAEPHAGASAIPLPLDAAAGSAAFRGRPATTGDIEAELFGPGSGRFKARAEPAPRADVGLSAAVPSGAAAPDGFASLADEPQPTENVASVFLSERVLGKRRMRKTTGFLRRSGQLRAVANRWADRTSRRARRLLSAIDRVTGKVRLPLANIVWAATIAGLALLFGLALPFAGGILAACLILTIAGQPARNLIGIAGIMILSASLAEVVRQRERFLEIFLNLFG
jgi:hypothetical protein